MRARTLAALMLCLGLSLTALAQTVDAPYPVASDAGTIEAVNIAESSLVVDGLRYRMALDATVEIAGSYGAFTMLKTGMRVYYEYLVISPTERRMVMIRELPDDVVLEQT